MKNKHKLQFLLAKNAFVDEGDGVIKFPQGLVITDDSEQWNGTKYDIDSMDLSQYPGQLTADHIDELKSVIGEVIGVRKRVNKVTIDAIRFAVNENDLALYTYNMVKAGFIKAFSIETMGPYPDDNGVYHDSILVGLSVVVMGNNKSAKINQIAYNSIKEAEQNGIDTTQLQKVLKFPIDKDKNLLHTEIDMKFRTIKNTRAFAVTLKYKNAEGEDTEVVVPPSQTVSVPEEQGDAVEAQVTDATEPKTPEPAQPPVQNPDPKNDEAIAAAVKNAVAPLLEKVTKMEQDAFDNKAVEPAFKPAGESKFATEAQALGYKERHAKQINLAWEYLKGGNQDAGRQLADINAVNLQALKDKGIVTNAVTLADFGNFVISPELLTEIEGFRSDFSSLLAKFAFRETLSLQMAYLKRNGDINMQEVDMCDVDGGNLKPISEYEATIETSNLHELAAVTPVCNAATRFLAVDLLGDVTQGYRTDFDRKRAQLVIARLQQAVNETGNTVPYATTSDVNALKSWVAAMAAMQEGVLNGVYIFSGKTYAEMLSREIGAGINTETGVKMFATGDQGPTFLGQPYVIVPNELMPTLNTAETKTFVIEGVNVTINQAVFYADPSTWSGRTSGGLSFDLSTEAAYEVNGTVKSAYQRNELVLRGSFFRGGAIRNVDKVVGIGSRGVS